jgi:heptosyltransferase-1
VTRNSEPQKIVVLCLSALGDFLNTLPVLAAIRRRFPSKCVVVVCERAGTAQLARSCKVADEVVLLPSGLRKNPLRLLQAAAVLRKLRPDITVETFASHGTCANMLSLASGARVRGGFDDGRFRRTLTHKVVIEDGVHYLELNRRVVAKVLGEPVDLPDGRFLPRLEQEAQIYTADFVAKHYSPYVVFSSGCDPFLSFKRWSLERWMQLALKVADLGINVVFVGDEREKLQIDPYTKDVSGSRVVNLCGKTDFADLVSVVEGSRLLVATDGMILHLCASMQHPCVGLFGPTDERWGGPWQQLDSVVRANLPDKPWYRANTVGKAFPAKMPAYMEALDVDTVWEAVRRRLDS